MQRIIELTLLEVNAGEPERGLVPHRLIDGAFEHRLYGAPRALVHAIVELEVADLKFGVVDVIVKRIEFGFVQNVVLGEFGVEPLECVEILSLVSVIERLAEIGVPQVAARDRTGSKSQGQGESDESSSRSHRLPFPKRDRSVAGTRSGHSQSDQLWLHLLAESKLSRAAEVRAALKLAVDKHVQLVIPGRHVADVDPLHAALAQGLELLEAVDVVRRELAVDLEPHGVEPHRVVLGQRDEDRDLRPRRIQQLLLQLAQLRRDPEDVRLDLLDLLVEALHLLLVALLLLLLIVLLLLLRVALLRPAAHAGQADQGGNDEGARCSPNRLATRARRAIGWQVRETPTGFDRECVL